MEFARHFADRPQLAQQMLQRMECNLNLLTAAAFCNLGKRWLEPGRGRPRLEPTVVLGCGGRRGPDR